MAYFGGVNSERPWPRVNPASVLLFVLALACMIVSAYVLFATDVLKKAVAVQQQPAAAVVEPAPVVTMTDVLVPVSTIKAGRRLRPEMFRRESRNVQGMEGKLIDARDEVGSYFALTNIPEGTLLFREQVSDVPPRNLITARIPEGFRAVSISVDAESGVEGWARPGAKVDVVWTTTQQRGRQMVSIIVENAEVLSAERSTETSTADNRPDGKPLPAHITLLVSVKEAQKIQLAKTTGSLSLNLRGESDGAARGNESMTVDRLLKASGGEVPDDVQGTVQYDGQEYQLKGGKLVAASQAKKVN